MIDSAGSDQLSPKEAALLQFSMAMVFDQLNRFEEAMISLNVGHGILRALQTTTFDRLRLTIINDRLISLFSNEFLSSSLKGSLETEKPIFVIGWQRSGTTLIETILSNHHQVRAGGELPFWVREVGNVVDLSVPNFHEREGLEAASRYLKKLNELDSAGNSNYR